MQMTNPAVEFVLDKVKFLNQATRRRSRDISHAHAVINGRKMAVKTAAELTKLRARSKAEQAKVDELSKKNLAAAMASLWQARMDLKKLVDVQTKDRRMIGGLIQMLKAVK